MTDSLEGLQNPNASPRATRVAEIAIGMMKNNYSGAITLDDMAAAVGYSVRNFIRLFVAATGINPGRYYAYLRYVEAARLLRETPLTIGQICSRVGFAHHGFALGYRGVFGMTPADYRKLACKGKELPKPNVQKKQ